MGAFLEEVVPTHVGGRILIIGTRATHGGLEHWLNHVPRMQLVSTPFDWQSGWSYRLNAASRCGHEPPASSLAVLCSTCSKNDPF